MKNWKLIGPGLVLAAAGVGVGDIVDSAVGGAKFGYVLLWAILIGALIKFIINEGLARYQLSSNKALLEGWQTISKWVNYLFVFYLIVWSFVVGGAILTSQGIVTNVLFPIFSSFQWSVILALGVLAFVRLGRYKWFERVMQVFILIMVLSVVMSVILVKPDYLEIIRGMFTLSIPTGSIFNILAIIGGVGATVTIMSYGYWIREKGWEGKKHLKLMRTDLSVGYGVTALFSICVLILASTLVYGTGRELVGRGGIIQLGELVGQAIGPVGYWIFMIGFWAAITSTLISFYQAIPYLFADWYRIVKKQKIKGSLTNTKAYKWYQLYCVFPPIILVLFNKPIYLTLVYSALGAVFMPFMILTLLYLGMPKRIGKLKNSTSYTIISVLILALYVYLGWKKLTGL